MFRDPVETKDESSDSSESDSGIDRHKEYLFSLIKSEKKKEKEPLSDESSEEEPLKTNKKNDKKKILPII